MGALPASESDSSTCLRANPTEASDLLPTVTDGGDLGVCQPDSCTPSSEHHPGSTAFMKVLDSLQKKQMNTSLCERIRKVYGDLECEYCGKERRCWSGVPLSAALLPSSPGHSFLAILAGIPFELMLLCREHLLPEAPSSVIDRRNEPVSEVTVGAFQESAGMMHR